MASTATGCLAEKSSADVIIQIAKPVLRQKKLFLVTKRVFDIVCSFLGLLILAIPMMIIALIITIDSPGAPIFKQERLGINGKPFMIYKFRSMRLDAEENGPQWADEQDPRCTHFGQILRRTRLDELPQLWNVFCGDMAFIGPRPERKFFIDQIMEVDPRYRYLFQIRPGVTSYATLYNGYTDTLEKMIRRLRYDLFYLEHRSWGFDTKILFMTFMNIAFGKKF